MKRPAVTYRRVSTDRQAREGQSLSSQKELLQGYCVQRDWRIVRHCEDAGKSGRSRDSREGLEEALSLVKKQHGVLVVYSLSRLARSVIDAANILNELRAAKADLAVYDMSLDTTTPHGELVFNIFASIAQFESQQIGERVRVVNERTVSRLGYRTQGRQPIGWKVVNGRRVPCERERALVARVCEVAEGKSLHEAARVLNAAGEPTISHLRHKQSKEGWTARKVQHLLRCELNPVRRQGEELLGFEVAPLPAPVS